MVSKVSADNIYRMITDKTNSGLVFSADAETKDADAARYICSSQSLEHTWRTRTRSAAATNRPDSFRTTQGNTRSQ